MSKYIHPATLEAALRVASNLLPDDYREVTEGHGHDPLNALVVGFHNCDSVYFEVPNGEIAGMAGVHNGGQIWMLLHPSYSRISSYLCLEKQKGMLMQEQKSYCGILLTKEQSPYQVT